MMLSSSSDSESRNKKVSLKSTIVDGLMNKPFSVTLGSFISSLSFSMIS